MRCILCRFGKKKTRKEIPADSPRGMFQHVWQRKRQPSPGPQAYAFESLGLVQFTPIGPGIRVRQRIDYPTTGPQPYVTKAGPLVGIPTVAGQVITQPLFDPASGFVQTNLPILNNPFPITADPIAGQII